MKKRIAVVLCLAGFVSAEAADLHTVRASAEATVQATPDRAEITLGVQTTAADAATAGSENAELTQRVMQALKRVVNQSGTYKTVGYSVQPLYQYPRGGSPKLTGYEANDTLQVTLDDLSLAGKVIDSALQAGATNVGGISFTLRDASEVTGQALAEAAEKARRNAEAIARALHLRVTGVESAETVQNSFAPRMMAATAMQKVATPVTPGPLDISANVTVVLTVE